MKRLLAQIGITYFSVLAVAFYLSDTAIVILASCALLCAILFLLIRKTRSTIYLPSMAIAALVACLVNLGYTYFSVQPVLEHCGEGEHRIEAVLKDEPYCSYKKYYYRMETRRVDGEEVRIKLIMKLPYLLNAETDDTVLFTDQLTTLSNDYYRSKGFYVCVDDDLIGVQVQKARTHSFYFHAIRLRQKLREALDTLLPHDCATLCRAVFIGDKYALDLDVRESFRYAGASYFIVVSGMHFAVLCLLIMKLCRKFLNRFVAFGISMVFLVVYMAVTGFQPSVLRSGIMMIFYLLGATVRRQVYSLNHLGIAGIVMPFIVSPYGAGDIGLILSFYATMGILLFATPIRYKISFKDNSGKIYSFYVRSKLKKIINKREKPKKYKEELFFNDRIVVFFKCFWNVVARLLSVSLAASIIVFPLSVIVFKAFSLVTLLSSLFLYLLIYLILVLSLGVCLFLWLGPLKYLAILLSWPLSLISRAVLVIVGFLADLPFSYIYIRSSYFYVWLAVSILLGMIVLLYRARQQALRLAVFGSALILLAGVMTNTIIELNTFSLEVYYCGEGLCVGVNSGGSLYLLSMSANSQSRYGVMQKLSDRYGGAELALCRSEGDLSAFQFYSDREFAFSRYLLYDKKDDKGDADILTFRDGETFVLDDDLIMTLAVKDQYVVPVLNAGGREILIVPYGCTLRDIPAEYRSPDILVMTKLFEGADELTCTDLIISDSADFSCMTADSLRNGYDHVYMTCNGDISYDLR